MGKTSKSQIKAVRAYEKRNPALTYYQTRRNNARAFVSSSAERFEEAKQAAGINRYHEDLESLRDMIDEKLNEM
ncbi:hypothetical protein NQ504_06335 [Ligilactobacillus ruminis]|uniref:Uncharacterized protein n=1 Tax=Ligilactobacillus ruminis ATCC 25644 TaxID=525362 RepID=E7FRH2_9LACO|nr:hypothetical protein [Ligilactobacillus ruminis]EFZ34559.1 hypothetical protein HMPREF0542_11499 [Ligilactobacillus ruminis ATCC 25644]EGX97710.1 hypothetical protein ANHS_1697 [Ligilactobacillus ruminis ATCC 25644]UWP39365.1 hypothetical protein NQ504_06335 [Ligilactobacillus ruminis]